MPTSEARISANQNNAAKSCGPKTPEGKEQSRRNALKHGMTGAGVVLPEKDAIELARRSTAFVLELKARGEIEVALARRAALSSVRMERGADQQIASLTEYVRKAELGFVLPDDIEPEEADRLRTDFARRSMFDPSKEAAQARRYEAAAERGFYRALKELRQYQAAAHKTNVQQEIDAKAATAAEFESMLASLSAMRKQAEEPVNLTAERAFAPTPKSPSFPNYSMSGSYTELPFAIGKAG